MMPALLGKQRTRNWLLGFLLGAAAIAPALYLTGRYHASATARALRWAVAAEVRQMGGAGSGAATIDRWKSREMLQALNRSADSPAARPRGPIDFTVALHADEYRWSIYDPRLFYSSADGVIGRDATWYRVPASFAVWVIGLNKRTPRWERSSPWCSVEARPRCRHVLTVSDFAAGRPLARLPLRVRGCDVWYCVQAPASRTPKRWMPLALITKRYVHQWPESYAGRLVYYRFRWKFEDGTYGPWGAIVHNQVRW